MEEIMVEKIFLKDPENIENNWVFDEDEVDYLVYLLKKNGIPAEAEKKGLFSMGLRLIIIPYNYQKKSVQVLKNKYFKYPPEIREKIIEEAQKKLSEVVE